MSAPMSPFYPPLRLPSVIEVTLVPEPFPPPWHRLPSSSPAPVRRPGSASPEFAPHEAPAGPTTPASPEWNSATSKPRQQSG